MNLDDIKTTITKKIGPLPAWAWAIVVAGGIYWYRKKTAGTSTAATTASADTTSTPTSPPVTLQPGESVYNPSTGDIATAPGGGASTPTTPSADPGAAIASAISGLSATIAAEQAQPAYATTVPATSTPPVTTTATTGSNKKSKANKKPALKLPTKKPTTKVPKTQSKTKARSGSAIKAAASRVKKIATKSGGTTVTNLHLPANPIRPRTKTPTKSTGTRLHQKATVGMTRPAAPIQHPVATHPKAAAKSVQLKPKAAPPARAQTRKIVKPAPKPVKKRA